MWVTVMTSIPILAPTSILGTLTGMAGAIHYNVGKLATLSGMAAANYYNTYFVFLNIDIERETLSIL